MTLNCLLFYYGMQIRHNWISLAILPLLNINAVMKYRVIAFGANGSTKQGTVLYDTHEEAVKKAYEVCNHYHCYCRIEKVAA